MRPEDVPDELVEKAARAVWEADSPAPELGWPHWDVAVERAENGLWDLPKMVADIRSMVRSALAAVLPEIQAQALRDEAATWSIAEDLENWSEAEIRDAILGNAARLIAANAETK